MKVKGAKALRKASLARPDNELVTVEDKETQVRGRGRRKGEPKIKYYVMSI